MSLIIADLLTRNVLTASPDTTLATAASLMAAKKISCLVVVEQGKPKGIFTESDLVRAGHQKKDLANTNISAFLSQPILRDSTDLSVYEAIDVLLEQQVHHMLVIKQDGTLEGLVTFADILKATEFDDFLKVKSVSSVMSKQLQTMSKQDSVADALAVLSDLHISCVVIVEDGKTIGIFTERDVAQQLAIGVVAEEVCLNDVMVSPVMSMMADDSLFDASLLMREHGFRRLVILDEAQHPIGIVTQFDVIRGLEGDSIRNLKNLYIEAETKLKETSHLIAEKAELERIIDAASVVLYRLERVGDRFAATFVSPAITQMLGYDKHEVSKPGWWRKHIHPDDLNQFDLSLNEQSYIKGLKQVYRFANNEGEYLWIRNHARLIKHDDKPDEVLGSWMDISEAKQAELTIRELATRNELILKTSMDGVIIADDHGKILDVNPAYCAMVGYNKEELEAMHIVDLEALLTPEQVGEKIQHMLQQGSVRFESQHRCKNGDVIALDVSIVVMQTEGDVPLVVAFVRDISAQNVQRGLLQVSEEKYRSLFQEALDMMHIVDADGLIIDVNQIELETLGYTREEMIGKPVAEIVHPDFASTTKSRIGRAFEGEQQTLTELKIMAKNGDIIPVEVSATPQVDEQGNIIAMRGVLRDISDRKQKEELLARREKQLSVLAQAGRVINETLDEVEIGRRLVDFAKTMLNCASGAIGFYKQKKLCFREYYKGEERIDINLDFPAGYGVPGHVLATKQVYVSSDARTDEHVIPEIQQTLGFIKLIDMPILDANGDILACFEMHDRLDGLDFDAQDMEMLHSLLGIVTAALVNAKLLFKQKKMAEQLHLAQVRHEEAASIAKLGHWVINLPDNRVEWSAQTFEITGRDRSSFVPTIQASSLNMHPDDCEQMQVLLYQAIENQTRIDTRFRLQMEDGSIKWVDLKSQNECAEDGRVIRVLGTIQDVTAIREKNEQLHLLKNAVASVNESILITDAKGVIVYINPAFKRVTGYDEKDALGKTPAILSSKLQSEGFYENLWSNIAAGKPWVGRIVDRKKDGTIFPANLSVAPIFDRQGRVTHFVAVHEDLTATEALQKQIIQTQKMEAVSTMVGGVAHDFNNILAGIVGNFYLIRMKHKHDQGLVSRVINMEKSVQRASKMIQQMMTFARTDSTEMKSVELKAFTKEICKLTEASVPENISFNIDVNQHDDFWVKCDVTQMQQVILNLISNASGALKDVEHGEITVTLDKQQPPAALIGKHLEFDTDGGWYRVSCKDNGCGIPRHAINHVFEPFFTTKPVGEGTGLGMAMVFGAVQSHRGLVDIESALNGGTEVSIWLPARSDKGVQVEGEHEADIDGEGKMLLLVDDEEELRLVLSEILRNNGFRVVHAFDGENAVQVYQEHIGKIDLVLMDVVMPNKGGVVAAREIRELNPDVPVIFQTGYGEKTQIDAAASIAHSIALQKPLQVPELLKSIATLLNLKH